MSTCMYYNIYNYYRSSIACRAIVGRHRSNSELVPATNCLGLDLLSCIYDEGILDHLSLIARSPVVIDRTLNSSRRLNSGDYMSSQLNGADQTAATKRPDPLIKPELCIFVDEGMCNTIRSAGMFICFSWYPS